MSAVRYVLCGLILWGLTTCSGNIACQSPPESLRLILRTDNGTDAVSPNNPDQVAVSYFQNGHSATLRDLIVRAPGVESIEVLQVARQTSDTTRFYVSVGGRPKGVIQLRTYVDTRRCQGWTRAQELRFNGQSITYDNMKPGYVLIVTP